jgi:hypothetical protein
MTTIQIELAGPAAEKVRRFAEAEHRAEAEIVRDSLEAYAPTKRKLPTGVGKYRIGQNDLAQKDEEILAQAVKEGQWP